MGRAELIERDEPSDPQPDPEGLGDWIAIRDTPRGPIQRVGLLVAALVLFALGVVGWLVPVVTGIPFYIAGAVCLGLSSRRAARLVNRLERRFPHRLRLLLRRRKPAAVADPDPNDEEARRD